jgi:hypothetical protein
MQKQNSTKPKLCKDKSPDSSEVCHNELEVNIGFSGVRKHTSIRCDRKLWKTFKTVTKNNGLSTCDILEKLILGFCIGYSTRVAQPTTINVIVDAPRVVRRVRRRQLVFEDEVQENFYDRYGCWITKPDAQLNEFGHAKGCHCQMCGGR